MSKLATTNTYRIVDVKCPDGMKRRARLFENGSAFVRVRDRWIKGKRKNREFIPTGDGINGNPFKTMRKTASTTARARTRAR